MKKSLYIILYMILAAACEDLAPTRNTPQTVSVSISDIGETSAICHLTVTPKGATQKAGVIYGTDSLLQTGTSEATPSGSNTDIVTLSGLNNGVTYYLKPYAADKQDVRIYGDIRSFTTVALDFSSSSIDASPTAGTYKLTISCNDAWTVASNQSWCTVQPTSGTGNGEVTVSVQENNTPEERSAVLTVTTEDISKQVNLLQQKVTTLNLSPSSIEASSTAGSYKLTITCNDAWTVTSDQSWCTVLPTSGTDNGEVTISVQENITSNKRPAVLTVTTGNISQQVNLLQQWVALTEFGNGTTAASNFGGGDGTQSNPYLITDARHLKKLVDDTNDGQSYQGIYFKLTIDIQVTADEWIPIGSSYYNPFSGTVDGDEHTISGEMRSANYEYFGFFGRIHNATVSNLNIATTVENKCNLRNASNTGALAGILHEGSNVRNCNISGSVTGGTGISSDTGGMAGCAGGSTVHNCNVSATVRGGCGNYWNGPRTGGVVGYMQGSGEISNCTVSGSIIGGDATEFITRTGGIVGSTGREGGYIGVNNITNCTVSAPGSVIAGNSLGGNANTRGVEVGGIVGCLSGNEEDIDIISGCTNNVPVIGKDAEHTIGTGGLVGRNFGKIHTSLNTGNVSSPGRNTGGLIGYNRDPEGSIYSCCTNRGSVNSQPPSDENQIGGGGGVTPCPDGHAKR
jgi:hypothetical protein